MHALVWQLIVKWNKIYACNKKCKSKTLHHQQRQQQTRLKRCMRTLRQHVNLMVLTEPSSCILKLMHVHMYCGCSGVATLLCAKCICPALIGALDHNHHRHFDDYFFTIIVIISSSFCYDCIRLCQVYISI